MNEQEWLTTNHVGSMLRYLTHEVHVAPDAIGDHRRAHPLISERQIALFDEACWERFHLNIDDVAVQQPPTPGAADLLRCIKGNPFRPVTLTVARTVHHAPVLHTRAYCPWLTPTVLSLAEAAYLERPGRKCEKCHGKGRWKRCNGCGGEWAGDVGPDCFVCGHPYLTEKTCPICHGTGRIEDGTLDPFRLGLVADALEEAGCVGKTRKCEACNGTGYGLGCADDRDNPPCGFCHGDKKITYPHPILAHLRSPGPHVRGCWALGLLLNQE